MNDVGELGQAGRLKPWRSGGCPDQAMAKNEAGWPLQDLGTSRVKSFELPEGKAPFVMLTTGDFERHDLSRLDLSVAG